MMRNIRRGLKEVASDSDEGLFVDVATMIKFESKIYLMISYSERTVGWKTNNLKREII